MLGQLDLRVSEHDLHLVVGALKEAQGQIPVPQLTQITLDVSSRFSRGLPPVEKLEDVQENLHQIFVSRLYGSNGVMRVKYLKMWEKLATETNAEWYRSNIEQLELIENSYYYRLGYFEP